MGNTHNHHINTKQALTTVKPTTILTKTLKSPTQTKKEIKSLIFQRSKWRYLTLTDLAYINKNKPKILSTLELARLDFYNTQSLGLKILSKSLKDAKNIRSLIIGSGNYNTKELSHLLKLTNRWKGLKFHFNQADIKKFPKLRRYQDLASLEVSFDEPENNKTKENLTNHLSQQTRGLPRLKNFSLSFNLIEGIVIWADTNYIPVFVFKYPRSLSSLTLSLNCSDNSLQKLLCQFISHVQHLSRLEHLNLDSDIISANIQPQLWKIFFEKTQQLKSLCLRKSFDESDQQEEAGKAFLYGFRQLKNLISLEINCLYLSGESQAQGFIEMLSQHLASFPHFKSLSFSLSAPIYMNNCPTTALPYLFSSINNLIQLERLHLNFNCNKITNNFLQKLAQSLRNLHNLKTLKISLSTFEPSQQEILFFAEILRKLTHIQILDLNFPNTDLGHASMEVLSKGIAELPLTFLHITLGRPKPNNTVLQKMSGLWEGIHTLIPFFSVLSGFNHLSTLSLNLSTFDISIPEYKHFALALRELQQIKSLSLVVPEFDSSNNFETLQYFLSSLAEMPILTSLLLDFKGRGPGRKEISHLASNLGGCISLYSLELRFSYGENFDEETFHYLLSGIASLSSSLKNLQLSLEGTPKFDCVQAYRLVLKDLTALRHLETLCLYSLFGGEPTYPDHEIERDLKKKLRDHPNFKRLMKLEIGNFQVI